MEKLVDVAMRHERQTDLLDRVVLAVGAVSLCLALGGTLFANSGDVAIDTAPSETAPV